MANNKDSSLRITRSGLPTTTIHIIWKDGKKEIRYMTYGEMREFFDSYELIAKKDHGNGHITIVGREIRKCNNCGFWKRTGILSGDCECKHYKNVRTKGGFNTLYYSPKYPSIAHIIWKNGNKETRRMNYEEVEKLCESYELVIKRDQKDYIARGYLVIIFGKMKRHNDFETLLEEENPDITYHFSVCSETTGCILHRAKEEMSQIKGNIGCRKER